MVGRSERSNPCTLGRDGRNLQIGHAYLLESGKPVTDFSRFVRILAEDIIPLLEEYCYEDYGALTQILGKGMVDESKQRIREELFAPSRHDELVQALLSPAPEIATSPDAATAQAMPEKKRTNWTGKAEKAVGGVAVTLGEWEILRPEMWNPAC